MDQTSIVAYHTVSAYQQVICHWISENLNTQCVSYDFFSLFVEVRVDEGNIVITSDAVSKGWEFLLNSYHFDSLRKWVTDVSKLVVSGVVGYKQTLFVSGGSSTDDTSASHSGLDDRDEGAEFWLKDTVEVIGASGCD